VPRHDRDTSAGIERWKRQNPGAFTSSSRRARSTWKKEAAMTPEQVLEQATLSVRFARKHP